MVVEILIRISTVMMNLISRIVPNWSIPDYLVDGFSTFVVYVLRVNEVVPVKAIFAVIGAIVAFKALVMFINIIGGIISLLRGGGKLDV